MISRLGRVSGRTVLALLTLAPIPVLLGLLFFAPPDGIERSQLLQFFGRFHPLSVHLPIALLMLVPVLELAGRSRHFPYLLPAANFVLGVATLGAIMAALLGWCLARNGGYSGPLVTQHMWAGIAAAGVAWLCWFLRTSVTSLGGSSFGVNRLYAATLLATVGLVSFTGYRGGQVSQGENHLTEFMPAPLGAILGVEPEVTIANSGKGGAGTYYAARIQPLLTQHCVTCHGRSKHKSSLRLDSFDAVMHGGKHGAVIKPGDAKGSELLRRVTLAPSDDQFMPPDGKRPLTTEDGKRIEQWIASGASGTVGFDGIKDGAASTIAEVVFEEIDTEAVAKQRASIAPVVAQLQQRFPNVLGYESRGLADIVITASWMGAKFGDKELAALAPLNDKIVSADFSSTSITDKSASGLGAMKRLRVLDFKHTKIGDATVQALGSLNQLESLNLYDTSVSEAILPELARSPKLRQVYAGQTKISAQSSLSQGLRDKLVF